DVVVDRADPQAAKRDPSGFGSNLGHGFGNYRISLPMEFQSGQPASGEEVRVAAAEKVESHIENGILEHAKCRTPDQAIAAAVDDRHRAAHLVSRAERGMTAQRA